MKQTQENVLATFWGDAYFPALDGLRAFCVAMVVTNHMSEPMPGGILGYLGVDVFFVLSGFLITTLLLREKEKYGSVTFKGFYIRRAFRILPIYYFVFLLYIPTVLLTHDAQRWHELKIATPYLLSFNQEFRPEAAGNIYGQSWSLGFEEKFYLLWPLLLLWLYPVRRWRWAVLVFIGAALFFLPQEFARSYYGLFIGAVLGVVLDKSSKNALQNWLIRMPAWAAALLVAAAYILYSRVKGNTIFAFSTAIALLVGTLVLRRGALRKVLENRVLVLVGKRSYAMYLVHVLVLHAVATFAVRLHLDNWWFVLTMTCLGSFVVATLLYYAIEKPCIQRGRAFSARFRKRMADGVTPDAAGIAPLRNPTDLPADL